MDTYEEVLRCLGRIEGRLIEFLCWIPTVAGTIATVYRSRIPWWKIPPFPLMVPFLLATTPCTA